MWIVGLFAGGVFSTMFIYSVFFSEKYQALGVCSKMKSVHEALKRYEEDHGMLPPLEKNANVSLAKLLFFNEHNNLAEYGANSPDFYVKMTGHVESLDEENKMGNLSSGENVYSYWGLVEGADVSAMRQPANRPLLSVPMLANNISPRYGEATYDVKSLNGYAVILQLDGAIIAYKQDSNGKIKKLLPNLLDTSGKVMNQQFRAVLPLGCIKR